MKIKDLIQLGILNIVTNLKITISIIIGFIVIIEVVLVSSAYGISMNDYISDMVHNNASMAFCSSWGKAFNNEQIEKFKNDPNIEGIRVIQGYDMVRFCEDNNKVIVEQLIQGRGIPFGAAMLKMDGVSYSGKNDSSNSIYRIGVMQAEDNLQFSNSELKEYRYKLKKDSPFLAGGEFTKKNQIILTDNILKKFNLNQPPSEYIGKKVNLGIAVESGEFYIEGDYEICGVLDLNFSSINARIITPQILLSSANDEYYNAESIAVQIFGKGFRETAHFYNNYYEDIDNLQISSATTNYAEVETQYILFKKIVLVMCFIIGVSVMVFVYVLIYFYYNKKMRYICIQKAMGMNDGKLFMLIFGELGIMQIAALVMAVPLYCFVMKELNHLLKMAVSNSFQVTVQDSYKAVGCAIIVLIVLNTFVTFLEFNKTRKHSVMNRNSD